MVFVRNLRPIHSLSRLLKPNLITSCRYVTGTAVKEEINTELLNAYNQDILAGGAVPVFRRALLFPTRVALQDEVGIYTYAGLHQAASALCTEIANMLSGETERTVAYMCGNDASHVIVQWAIWMSGNIAVPLTPLHPPEMLAYFLSDSGACLTVCTQEYEKTMRPLTVGKSRPLLVTTRDNEITAQLYQPNTTFLKSKPEENLSDAARDNMWYGKQEALIIYTSGTTSKPKGVVWSHSMLSNQIASLHTAWQYSANDVVLHALPLHHIHGQLNSLNASLAAGARLRMLPTFTAHAVWARLLGMGEREECKVTVFHGVPAMYARLAQAHEQMFSSSRTAQYVRSTLEARIRTMCSGSAPLVESLARRWHEICLQRLGIPSSKDVFVDSDKFFWRPPTITNHQPSPDGTYTGELLLKGPGIFTRYLNTAATDFTKDGWFRTGDIVTFSDGKFRILGRSSVDIIKTGGYKVSALQIETAILENANILDVAVIGVDDDTYGEVVGAVVVLKPDTSLKLTELRAGLEKRLAPYQLPRSLVVVHEMPRNAMSKLDKKVIKTMYAKDLVIKKP